MSPAGIPIAVLPVGDARRPALRHAVLGTLIVAGAFTAFTWLSKETPSVYAHTPWQDDPYDTIVTFAIFFVPLLAIVQAVRVLLCRPDQPLPVARAVGLLRGSRLLCALIGITLLSDAASVALGVHRSAWTTTSAVLVAGVAALAAGAGLVGFLVRRVAAVFGESWVSAPPGAQAADWLADLFVVAERSARHVDTRSQALVRVLEHAQDVIAPVVRRHPLATAATWATGFGTLVAATQAAGEGVGLTALLFLGVAAAGMFAFLAGFGAHLFLVQSSNPAAGGRRRLIDGVVAGCAALPLALAFRGSLWWVIGSSADAAGLSELALLIMVAGCASFSAVILVETVIGVHPRTGAGASHPDG